MHFPDTLVLKCNHEIAVLILRIKILEAIKHVPVYIKSIAWQIIYNKPISEICWDLRLITRTTLQKLCQDTNVLKQRFGNVYEYWMFNEIPHFCFGSGGFWDASVPNQKVLSCFDLCSTQWRRDKMAAISRRHFQMHFLERICINSD